MVLFYFCESLRLLKIYKTFYIVSSSLEILHFRKISLRLYIEKQQQFSIFSLDTRKVFFLCVISIFTAYKIFLFFIHLHYINKIWF